MSNCKACKYWERSDISDGLLEEDEQGLCDGLLGGVYYVQLDSVLIDEVDDEEFDEFYEQLKITTEHDFYCRNFKPKEEEKMQEHEKRMIEEYKELKEKSLKLLDFLYTKKFNELEGLDQSLLCIQHHHMEAYKQALHDRLVRFGTDLEEIK